MVIDPCNSRDREKAVVRFDKLMSGKRPFVLKEEKPGVPLRTLPQNNIFHMWCRVLADHLGYVSVEECKTDVKRNILGMRERVDRFSGEVTRDDFETRELSKEEFGSFLDKMKIWAMTEFDCYLPYWMEEGYDEMVKRCSGHIK